MTFEVGVVAQFEAAHSLRGAFGPATRRHGHTYRVEVAVRGASLRDDGTLFDITRLQEAVQEATGALHYQDLDDAPGLAGRNATAEVVAQHLLEQVGPRIAGLGLTSLAVRVWESPGAYAGCEQTLTD